MARARREFESAASPDFLEVLRSLQHQLGNALSAVASWAVAVERKAASLATDREPLDALAQATEQALSVAASLRHLLSALESQRVGVNERTLLGQVRDFVHALATRSVEVQVEPPAGPGWFCPVRDCFLLVARVLEAHKDPLRRGDRIVVAGERGAPLPPQAEIALPARAGLIRVLVHRQAATTPEVSGGIVASSATGLNEALQRRLSDCRVQVSWRDVSPTESVLQIVLPTAEKQVAED